MFCVLCFSLHCILSFLDIIVRKVPFRGPSTCSKWFILSIRRICSYLFVVCLSFQARRKAYGPFWYWYSCIFFKWKPMFLYPNLDQILVILKPVHWFLDKSFRQKLPIVFKVENVWSFYPHIYHINSFYLSNFFPCSHYGNVVFFI